MPRIVVLARKKTQQLLLLMSTRNLSKILPIFGCIICLQGFEVLPLLTSLKKKEFLSQLQFLWLFEAGGAITAKRKVLIVRT